MDSVGAILGPLLGVALLGWAQGLGWEEKAGPFRFVFWLTLIPGVLASLAFLFLVKDPGHSPNPALNLISTLRGLPPRFKSYLKAVGVFGIGDFSHSLLILAATQWLTPSMGIVKAAQIAGLCYVGRNVVQVIASYPVGMLADRYGARRVLGVGYVLGVLTAASTALMFHLATENLWLLGVVFLLAGLYMAVQEALEATVTAEMVSPEIRATGFGALATVNGTAKFISSSAVGILWTAVSPVFGFGLAAVFMAAGTISLAKCRTK